MSSMREKYCQVRITNRSVWKIEKSESFLDVIVFVLVLQLCQKEVRPKWSSEDKQNEEGNRKANDISIFIRHGSALHPRIHVQEPRLLSRVVKGTAQGTKDVATYTVINGMNAECGDEYDLIKEVNCKLPSKMESIPAIE